MATNYFYKEIEDEADPELKIPIRIDTLLMPKIRLGDDVPAEDRTKYVDTGRDFEELFERYDPERYVRACEATKETSNFYLGAEPGEDLTDIYDVKGELGKGHVIGEIDVYKERKEFPFTIPLEFRDRIMYWSFYFKDLDACSGGGFTVPGQTEVVGWAGAFYQHRYFFEMQLHEVELVKGFPENDLVTRYAAPKDSQIPWWKIAAFTPRELYAEVNGVTHPSNIKGAPYYGVVYKWYWEQFNNSSIYGGILTAVKGIGELEYRVWGEVSRDGGAMMGIVGPYIPEEETFSKEEELE